MRPETHIWQDGTQDTRLFWSIPQEERPRDGGAARTIVCGFFERHARDATPPARHAKGVCSLMLHSNRGRFGQSLLSTLCFSLVLGACSTQPTDAGSTAASPSPSVQQSQARSASPAATSVSLRVPPGVDLERLAPVSPDDPKARLSLAEALAMISPTDVLPPARSAAPPTDDVLRATTRLYLEARAMSIDGRYFDSIRSLEQALKLDPGATACMRLMADNYLSTIGPARALRLYEDILALEPDDLESLLRLGTAAWQRRDAPRAAGLLGKAHALLSDEQVAAGDQDIWFLTAHELGQVLLAQGYDEAGVSVWHDLILRLPDMPPESARFQSEVDRLYRVAPEMWRDLGDAYCRLQRFDEAIDVYGQAFAAARVSNEDMLPRLIWALGKAGRTQDAIEVLLEAIDDPQQTNAIELVSLFRDTPQSDALAAALRQRLGEKPGELRYVQAIAGLLPPDRSDAIILDFLAEHGGDSSVLSDLLPWAVQRLAPVQPVRLIITLAQKSGELPDHLLDELVALTDEPRQYLKAWDDLPAAMKKSEEGQLVRIGLLFRDYQYGEARTALDRLLADYPNSTPGLLSKATVLLVLNLTDEAAEVVESIKGRAGDPIELTYDRALMWAQIGEVDKGLGLLDDLQAKRPDDIDIAEHLRRKARLLSGAGRNEDAAAVLKEAMTKSPRDPATFGALIRLYGFRGPLQNGDQFRELVRGLYSAAPESRVFRMLRAEQDAGQGRFDDAIAAFQLLLAEDATDQAALEGLVQVWIASGRASEASQWLATKRINRPGDRHLRDAWLQTLIADHRGGDVVDILRGAIATHPLDFGSYRLLETALKSVGREEEAQQVTRDRWSQQPDSVAKSLAMAELDVGQGQGESALDHLRAALTQASDHLGRHIEDITSLASRIDAEGLRSQALGLIEAIGEEVIARKVVAPPSVFIAYMNAVAELGRPLDAIINSIEKARTLQPDIELEMTAVATVSLARHERLDDACALCDRWLGTERPLEDREAGLTQWRLAQCAIRDEPERAINLVRRAHQTEAYKSMPILNARPVAGKGGGNPLAESLYVMSGEFSAQGNDLSHEVLLEEALKVDPDHALANNDLGYSLADRNERLSDAEAMLVKATMAKPTDSAVLDSLGWVRYKLGKLENPDEEPREVYENAAIPLLEDAALLRRSEGRPEIDTTVILDHLGDAYWRAGRKDKALDTWQQSVRNFDQFIQLAQQTGAADNGNAEVEFYRKYYGETIDATRSKIKAAESGKEPPVASSPTLDKNQP